MFVKENQPHLLCHIRNLFERAQRRTGELQVVDDPALMLRSLPVQGKRLRVVGDSDRRLVIVRAHSGDKGHGRYEERRLETLTVPSWAQSLDWPGAVQIFRIERFTRQQRTRKTRGDVVYGITSLSAKEAGPAQLLQLCRGHWSIENRLHWVRDVTFDEDRSTVRSRSIPQVMAALRNTVIGILRLAGHRNIAAACRSYANRAYQTVHMILKPPTFE